MSQQEDGSFTCRPLITDPRRTVLAVGEGLIPALLAVPQAQERVQEPLEAQEALPVLLLEP